MLYSALRNIKSMAIEGQSRARWLSIFRLSIDDLYSWYHQIYELEVRHRLRLLRPS